MSGQIKKNTSEKLFEEYLTMKGLILDKDFFYEPDLRKQKRPDYLVQPISSLFEIKEFSDDSDADQKMYAAAQRHEAIRLDPYTATREKINAARKKFQDYKKHFSCVLILHRGNSISADLDTQMVAGSAYGDIALNMSIDGKFHHWTFDKNAELSPTKNRTLSAIAVIEEIYPHQAPAREHYWKEHDMPHMLDTKFLKEYQIWLRANGYDIRKRYVRLRVIINPFATKPISHDFFNQPFDEIHIINDKGEFVKVK